MAGYLTTHVLDTARGCPAADMTIDLYRIARDGRSLIRTVRTNADGRTDAPILPEAEFEAGTYELVFHAGDYIDAGRATRRQPPFLDEIPIRFGMAEAAHYHVPLLLSPYGYATYRGS